MRPWTAGAFRLILAALDCGGVSADSLDCGGVSPDSSALNCGGFGRFSQRRASPAFQRWRSKHKHRVVLSTSAQVRSKTRRLRRRGQRQLRDVPAESERRGLAGSGRRRRLWERRARQRSRLLRRGVDASAAQTLRGPAPRRDGHGDRGRGLPRRALQRRAAGAPARIRFPSEARRRASRRGHSVETDRGDVAAATWISPWRRDAAAETWMFRGDGIAATPRPRRG